MMSTELVENILTNFRNRLDCLHRFCEMTGRCTRMTCWSSVVSVMRGLLIGHTNENVLTRLRFTSPDWPLCSAFLRSRMRNEINRSSGWTLQWNWRSSGALLVHADHEMNLQKFGELKFGTEAWLTFPVDILKVPKSARGTSSPRGLNVLPKAVPPR